MSKYIHRDVRNVGYATDPLMNEALNLCGLTEEIKHSLLYKLIIINIKNKLVFLHESINQEIDKK